MVASVAQKAKAKAAAKAANLQKVGAAVAAIEKEIADAKANAVVAPVPSVLGAPGAVGSDATPAGLGAPGPVGTSVTPRSSPARAAAAAGGGEERGGKEDKKRRRHSDTSGQKRRRRSRHNGEVTIQHMFHGWPVVLKFKTKQT